MDESPQEKTCTKCKLPKPLKDFRNDKHSKDGKTSRCRECLKADGIAYYGENRDNLLLKEKQWRIDNPEKAHARDRKYDESRREEKAVYNAWYYATHQEQELARCAIYYSLHQEDKRIYHEGYRPTRKQETRAYAQQYRKDHPEVHRANHKRYKARKKGAAIVDLTHEQFEELKAAANYRCAYCPADCIECKNKTHDLHQDHVEPLSKGGNDTVQNVVPCCQSHNSKKGNRNVPTPVQLPLLTQAPPRRYKRRCAS